MTQSKRVALRLYVAGDAPNSQLALQRLRDFCERYLANRHQLEVVDVIREPQRALADQVLLTPMLVKVAPGPVRKIIGNLSEPEVLARALEVEPK